MEQSNSSGRGVPVAGLEENASVLAERERHLTEVLAMVARGDHSAFGTFYDLTSPIVYSLALRMLANPADAEEVTLDVFAKAWRAAATYDSRRGTVLAWLVTLTRSRAVDRLRSRATREKREESGSAMPDAAASAPDPEEQASSQQHRGLVSAAMAKLSAAQREAIELAFFSGLTHTEISERLAQPVGTIKTRIRQGMLRLRDALAAAGVRQQGAGGMQ
jgi:RNA polymerase sigma-70 factor (ECF subfamily)